MHPLMGSPSTCSTFTRRGVDPAGPVAATGAGVGLGAPLLTTADRGSTPSGARIVTSGELRSNIVTTIRMENCSTGASFSDPLISMTICRINRSSRPTSHLPTEVVQPEVISRGISRQGATAQHSQVSQLAGRDIEAHSIALDTPHQSFAHPASVERIDHVRSQLIRFHRPKRPA